MSKVKIQGNASGTGVVTLTAPNTNTDRTITLPDGDISLGVGIDDNATSTAITIDANENVGIGTADPLGSLHIAKSGGAQLRVTTTTGGGGGECKILMGNQDSGGTNKPVIIRGVNGEFKVGTGDDWSADSGGTFLTRLTIDSSGNLLVGTTSTAPTTGSGFSVQSIGRVFSSVDSGYVASLNRDTNDGEILRFRKDGTTVGSIDTVSNWLTLTNQYGRQLSLIGNTAPRISPSQDNYWDVGNSSFRFDDIYATNGTIQTSDRNEKQDIEELSTAEQNVALACKGLLRKFRWQDSVAEKGDDARIHFGIIAQDLQDAFAAEGLDAGDYAMFISSTWYEKEVEVPAVEAVEAVEATYDDEGAELTPAVEAVEAKDSYTRTDTEDEPTDGYTERTRLGVRYPELLAFIISAI
jgi:hypothetical protein